MFEPSDRKYWLWVRWAARRLKSDGCTGVSELYHECCLQHDLAYRTGNDPQQLYCHTVAPISRAEADAQFRRSMQQRSKLRVLSPVAFGRWLGVRIWGKGRFKA